MSPRLVVVRHGSAGSRSRWTGPDHLRPLDRKGRRQAEGLVRTLTAGKSLQVGRILSSPYVRCVQTLEPLVERLGLDVEEEPVLAEGEAPAAVGLARRLVAPRGGPGAAVNRRAVVICTHGDIVPALLAEAAADGVDVGRSPKWPKGSTWILESRAGRFTARITAHPRREPNLRPERVPPRLAERHHPPTPGAMGLIR